jgi:hypothetical protein
MSKIRSFLLQEAERIAAVTLPVQRQPQLAGPRGNEARRALAPLHAVVPGRRVGGLHDPSLSLNRP